MTTNARSWVEVQRTNVLARSVAANGPFAVALVGLSGLALLVLWIDHAPVFDPSVSVDPWLYTAAFANFGYVFNTFGSTYYVSRLPWIIPGKVAYSLLPPEAAYVLLHVVYFCAGAVFVALLVRAYCGTLPSLVAFGSLVFTPLYYNAHYWDYVDGPEMTYVFAVLYFVLVRRPGIRGLFRMALGGFFAAAALTTHLYTSFFLIAAAAAYVVVTLRRPLARWMLQVGLDAAALVVGGAVLVSLCGLFSVAYGRRFLYFMPQIETLHELNAAIYKTAHYPWTGEPRILVPPLLLALLAILWRRPGSGDAGARAASRFAAGTFVYLAAVYGVLGYWEFFSNGTAFEISDRYSVVLTGTALCSGTVAYYLLRSAHGLALAAVAASTAAAMLAALLVYGVRLWQLVGKESWRIAIILMISVLVATAVLRLVPRLPGAPGLAALALVTVAFASALSAAASNLTYAWYSSSIARGNRGTFDVGMKLIDYLRGGGYQRMRLGFWYDDRPADSRFLEGVQSLYYFSYTYLGRTMPLVDSDLRRRMKIIRPQTIVMLCAEPSCANGPAALRRAGYSIKPEAERLLEARGKRIWVRLFRAEGV